MKSMYGKKYEPLKFTLEAAGFQYFDQEKDKFVMIKASKLDISENQVTARFADYETKLNKATQVIEGLINLTKTLAETPTGAPDVAVKTESNFKADSKISYDILFS